MSFSEKIGAELPFLRRYSRALNGSQASGDAYVRALLEAALEDKALRDAMSASRTALYGAFSRLWQASQVEAAAAGGAELSPDASLEEKLSQVAPLHRQALLLTSLEEFTPDQAGEVLDLSADEVERLVAQAMSEMEASASISVLIIEDEPLISMQLEEIVTGLGHQVAGCAATRSQALEVFANSRPGLVLADIQLADGSSGIDAVEDILAEDAVPVVFITAYPERLLTGERPEPTFLVTKPFKEAMVRAAISQALLVSKSTA